MSKTNLIFILTFLFTTFLINARQTVAAESARDKSYVEMDQQSESFFLKKVRTVKRLVTADQVRSILGEPNRIQTITGKEYDSKIRGYSFVYYIKRFKKEYVSRNDQTVYIYFNSENQVVDVSINGKSILSDNK